MKSFYITARFIKSEENLNWDLNRRFSCSNMDEQCVSYEEYWTFWSQLGGFALSKFRLMNQINRSPNTVVLHRCKAFDGNIDQDGHSFSYWEIWFSKSGSVNIIITSWESLDNRFCVIGNKEGDGSLASAQVEIFRLGLWWKSSNTKTREEMFEPQGVRKRTA